MHTSPIPAREAVGSMDFKETRMRLVNVLYFWLD